jgi:hypothetical protein
VQFPSGNATINLVNVIARAATALEAQTDSSGAYATIIANHTNYQGKATIGTHAAIIDVGGNQSYAPMFVDWLHDDYRQVWTSWTVDAGVNDPANGAFDVDGDPRTIGTTDMGADEFVRAPAATTGTASAVASASANVAGSVNPHGAPTTYRFQYGPTTAYGATTAVTGAGSGTSAVAASAKLGALRPATTYHYRLVATNSGGVTKGADRTFTTAAPPPTPPTSTPPTQSSPSPSPSPRSFPGVSLISRKLSYRHKAIALKLACPAGTAGRCEGRAKLRARHVRLGRTRFSIAPGQQGKVKLRVSRAGRRLLYRVHRLRGKETTAAHDGAGHAHTTVAKVRIRRR